MISEGHDGRRGIPLVRMGLLMCTLTLAVFGSGCVTALVEMEVVGRRTIPARFTSIKRAVLTPGGMLAIQVESAERPGELLLLRFPTRSQIRNPRSTAGRHSESPLQHAVHQNNDQPGDGEVVQVIQDDWKELDQEMGILLTTPDDRALPSVFAYRYIEPTNGREVTVYIQVTGRKVAKRPWLRVLHLVAVPVDAAIVIVTSPVTLWVGLVWWMHGPA